MLENTFMVCLLLSLTGLVLGLINPKWVIGANPDPTRVKVLLYFGLSSIAFFIAFGTFKRSKLEKIIDKGDELYYADLAGEHLDKLPSEFAYLSNLGNLDLSDNNFTEVPPQVFMLRGLYYLNMRDNRIGELPDGLFLLTNLDEIDFSGNPITTLPHWLDQMPNLKTLIFDDTEISSLPENLKEAIVAGKITIYLENTPYQEKGIEELGLEAILNDSSIGGVPNILEEIEIEGHNKGFGELAFRKLMGIDYGSKREFGKAELFYMPPITQSQADSLGEYLMMTGLFGIEKEVTMQILLNQKVQPPVYELRIVTNLHEAPGEEIKLSFRLQAILVSALVFHAKPVHFHLCDENFKTLTIVKSEDLINQNIRYGK